MLFSRAYIPFHSYVWIIFNPGRADAWLPPLPPTPMQLQVFCVAKFYRTCNKTFFFIFVVLYVLYRYDSVYNRNLLWFSRE